MTDNELIIELLNIRDQMEDESDAAVISAVANRLYTLRPAPPPPEIVQVRIAVAMIDNNNWVCRGAKTDGMSRRDEDNVRLACASVGHGAVGYLVVAHIPRPEIPVVQGTTTVFDPEATI
jgi:hypothetical protein